MRMNHALPESQRQMTERCSTTKRKPFSKPSSRNQLWRFPRHQGMGLQVVKKVSSLLLRKLRRHRLSRLVAHRPFFGFSQGVDNQTGIDNSATGKVTERKPPKISEQQASTLLPQNYSLLCVNCRKILGGSILGFPSPIFRHFLYLHVAIKMLSFKSLCYTQNSLLKHFVRESAKSYGEHFITFNVHCLFHLPNDVLRFCPQHQFTSFPF